MHPARILIGVLAATCLAASSAHADPVGNFRFGTTVYLRTATVDLEGNLSGTGGIPLSKPANTLDFDVAASDIGASLPITLHLHAIFSSTNLIHYHFNWSGNVDIDGHGHMLTSASGDFLVNASPTPPELTAIGNVALDALPYVSYINAVGDWGTKTLFVADGHFWGGFLPASLSGFSLGDGAPVCSDNIVAKTIPVFMALNHVAPPTGQMVFLFSPYPAGVSVPAVAMVSAGKKTTSAAATIAPGFVGTVHLRAIAGGSIATTDFSVGALHDCDPGSGGNGPPVAYNPDPGCIMCGLHVAINDWNERMTLVGRTYELIRGTTATALLDLFPVAGATSMSARAISNSHYLTGTVTVGATTQAYRANATLAPGQVELLGAMTPLGIGTSGTVVGSRVDTVTGRARAVAVVGTAMVDLILPNSWDVYASRALGINGTGEVFGTYTTTATGPNHGFYLTADARMHQLPATAATPVAINDAGQILANGTTAAGGAVATLVSATGVVTSIGSPSGYSGFVAKSMNKSGVVVGTATMLTAGPPITRAFSWTQAGGFRALSGLRRELPIVDDAPSITDANTTVVHGTNAAGVANLYVLPL